MTRLPCCSLLTCSPAWLGLRAQFSSLPPSQRAWGPAAKCEFISAQALRAWAEITARHRAMRSRREDHAEITEIQLGCLRVSASPREKFQTAIPRGAQALTRISHKVSTAAAHPGIYAWRSVGPPRYETLREIRARTCRSGWPLSPGCPELHPSVPRLCRFHQTGNNRKSHGPACLAREWNAHE